VNYRETQLNFGTPEVPNENAMIREVEKICQSPEFRTKEVLCRFLRYIVSEKLAGRGDEIKAFSIGVDVFNRDSDFDPSQDTLVRINAIRLRRMLDLYYSHTGKNDEIQINIPKGGYIPRFVSQSASKEDVKKGATASSEKLIFGEPSIAVFSFDDLGGDSSNAYFARGFSYELMIELSKYEDLQVSNFLNVTGRRTSSSKLHRSLMEKGIRFVVRGAVHGDKERINVLVELYDLSEERQVWSEKYSEKVTAENFIELQERIVRNISAEIGDEYGIILQQLTQETKDQKPQNLNTYSAILMYYNYLVSRSPESAEKALSALEKAVEDDPASGVVRACLAGFHGTAYGLDSPNADQSYVTVGELAEQAYLLEPNNFLVQNVLAFKYFLYDEKERFFDLAERMLKRNPRSIIRLGSLAFHLSLYGDWERGKQLLDSVMETHLEYPNYFYGATTLYYYRKEAYEAALTEAQKYHIPHFFWGPMLRAAVLGQLNRPVDAQTELQQLKRRRPDFAEKAPYLISRFVKEEVLVNKVIEGLEKAGLEIS